VLVFTWPRDRQVCVDRVTLVFGCKLPVCIMGDKLVKKFSEWVSVRRVNEHSFYANAEHNAYCFSLH